MPKITVYISDETKLVIDEMVKKEKRNVSFIADKLISMGIKETVRNKKRKNGLQQG